MITEKERIDAAHTAWQQGDDVPEKELALLCYWEGYRLGYGVENLGPMDYRAAASQFERWWDANAPDDDSEDEQPEVPAAPGVIQQITDEVAQDADSAFIPITAIDEDVMVDHMGEGATQGEWDSVRRAVTENLRERGFTIV